MSTPEPTSSASAPAPDSTPAMSNGDANPTSTSDAPVEPLNPPPFQHLPYKLDPNWKPAPGHLGNLTPEQQKALEVLKEEVRKEFAKPENQTGLGEDKSKGLVWDEKRMDDTMFLRFLRARKWDVAKAKEMLMDNERWRVDFGVDEIMRTFNFPEKEEVDKYYPQFYHKTDKEGRPIYIERLGFLDIKALYACTTQTRQLQRLVYEYEIFLTNRLPLSSAHPSVRHPITTSCTILDLHNVSLSLFTLNAKIREYVQQATKIGQDRYPECMGKFYIVNAPWVFSTVWSVIKKWLDPVTLEKIEILGSGEGEWKKLREEVGEDALPELLKLGGKCRCEEYREVLGGGGAEERKDGYCLDSDAGPWNPPSSKEA
ncbi:hypothetical protein D9758_004529 [Tetrapyrgos nigripes]|uniref:CRAL-TRIO domain-containing protein n=1 Tax=Tetrapyrgos nigripes TaxID=182062 RepID=A0A8H5H0B4_9AGAR|nr:hypothetical protein D9758_004529 [Tetrapyrgos nigripes]